VLVRRLVREGFLRVVPRTASGASEPPPST
jgi:hypothetical protein